MVAMHEPPSGITNTETQACYTIEQVATRIGLTKRTLRYYEEVGLLPPTDRTEGNYRRYCETDIQRLERIKELRELLGFSLTEIRNHLNAEEERGQIKQAYQQAIHPASKIAQIDRADTLIRGQLQLIEQKITGLEQMRTALLQKLQHYKQTRNELLNTE